MPAPRKRKCDTCRTQRKVCNGQQPCDNCSKSQNPNRCHYTPTSSSQSTASQAQAAPQSPAPPAGPISQPSAAMSEEGSQTEREQIAAEAPGDLTARASIAGMQPREAQGAELADDEASSDGEIDNADESGIEDAPAHLANKYSMQGGSQRPCEESMLSGAMCSAVPTYPCEKDHGGDDHFVCHYCRQTPLLHDVNEEEKMIKGFRLYLCEQCTNVRSQLPDRQLWEHPRRLVGETRDRKMYTCSCHEELHIRWICRFHRVQRVEQLKTWGTEKVKAFISFNQGRVCAVPGCRQNPPTEEVSDGSIMMWNCAACEDLVMAHCFGDAAFESGDEEEGDGEDEEAEEEDSE